jgi:hypothetical protein
MPADDADEQRNGETDRGVDRGADQGGDPLCDRG